MISCNGTVSLSVKTTLPSDVATCKVVYEDPAGGYDRVVLERADRGPDGFAAGVLLRTLRVRPRGGDVGENMSCPSVGAVTRFDVLRAEAAAALSRLGVGEGVLRLARSRGRTLCRGVLVDVGRVMLTRSVGGEGVLFRIIRLPL